MPVETAAAAALADGRAPTDGLGRHAADRPGATRTLLDDVPGARRRTGPIRGQRHRHRARPPPAPGQMWNWHDGKVALEYLFWAGRGDGGPAGQLRAATTTCTERVLPAEVAGGADARPVDDAQRELVRIAARALRRGHRARSRRLLPAAARASRSCAVAELVEAGELLPVEVEGWARAGLPVAGRAPAAARQRPRAARRRSTRSIWFRDRTERLFGFRYRIEIYTPAAQRVHGYYVLPFLLGEQLVARVDLKSDRQAGRAAGPAAPSLEPGARRAVAWRAELAAGARRSTAGAGSASARRDGRPRRLATRSARGARSSATHTARSPGSGSSRTQRVVRREVGVPDIVSPVCRSSPGRSSQPPADIDWDDRRRRRPGARRVRRPGLLRVVEQAEPGHRDQRRLPAPHPRGRAPVGARARHGDVLPARRVALADARADPAPAFQLLAALAALRAPSAARRWSSPTSIADDPELHARFVAATDGRDRGLHRAARRAREALRRRRARDAAPQAGPAGGAGGAAQRDRDADRGHRQLPGLAALRGDAGAPSTPTSRSARWRSRACASCSGSRRTRSPTSRSPRCPTAPRSRPAPFVGEG